jgi:hypothetical protein
VANSYRSLMPKNRKGTGRRVRKGRAEFDLGVETWGPYEPQTPIPASEEEESFKTPHPRAYF